MTSAQTELLQRFQDAAAEYIAATDLFGHAFGQDHPEIATAVGASGQSVGQTSQVVKVWAASHSGD